MGARSILAEEEGTVLVLLILLLLVGVREAVKALLASAMIFPEAVLGGLLLHLTARRKRSHLSL